MVWVTPILYLKERKMRPGVGNGRRILLTTEKGCMFMRLNHVRTSCVSDKSLCWGSFWGSEYSIFLQWVWFSSNSIGATPTSQPSLKVFGLARLAGLPLPHTNLYSLVSPPLHCKWRCSDTRLFANSHKAREGWWWHSFPATSYPKSKSLYPLLRWLRSSV